MMDGMRWLFGEGFIAWVQHVFGLGHPLPFRLLSLLGDTWGIIFVAGLAFWLFGRRALYAVVGIVVVSAATKLAMTDLFGMARPDGAGIVVYDRLEMGSFPSGHVYQGVAPWGLLYALGYVRLWVPASVALLVGLGRIYLGAHYLGDVLAAVAFAAALALLHARITVPVLAWLRERADLVRIGLAAAAIVATLVAWQLSGGAGPRRYEIYGMVVAAAVALPLEGRLVRYRPATRSIAGRSLVVLLGMAGIVACLAWDRSQHDGALLLGSATAGLATLWALLALPALVGAGRRRSVGRRPLRSVHAAPPAGGRDRERP